MNNINTNDLIQYAFSETTPDREKEIEDWLEHHQQDEDFVNSIIEFSLEENISTRADYEVFMKTQQKSLQHKISSNTKNRSVKNTFLNRKAIFFISIGILLFIIIGLFWYNSQPHYLPTEEAEEMLEREWKREKHKQLQAGGSLENWEDAFENHQYLMARQLIDKKIEAKEVKPRLSYFAGVLHLYLASNRSELLKAAQLLGKGKLYRPEIPTKIGESLASEHLFVAYVMLKEKTKAEELWQSGLIESDSLPPSTLSRFIKNQ